MSLVACARKKEQNKIFKNGEIHVIENGIKSKERVKPRQGAFSLWSVGKRKKAKGCGKYIGC